MSPLPEIQTRLRHLANAIEAEAHLSPQRARWMRDAADEIDGLRMALLVCERVLSFDLADMVTWGPNYRQQVKDALDAVRTALARAPGGRS